MRTVNLTCYTNNDKKAQSPKLYACQKMKRRMPKHTAFFRGEDSMEKNNKVDVYCPICEQKLGRYDGKSKIPVIVNCYKCKKQVVLDAASHKFKVKNIPERNCTSGMTFR